MTRYFRFKIEGPLRLHGPRTLYVRIYRRVITLEIGFTTYKASRLPDWD